MNRKILGKKSRARGKEFERLVRADLEKLGFIVNRWSNNVDFKLFSGGKLIPAKHTFNPFTKAMSAGNGFPDFSAHRNITCPFCKVHNTYNQVQEVIGVESKIMGILDRAEKQKLDWYLRNKTFSKIYIAKLTKKGRRNTIEYVEYHESNS